MGVEVAAAIVAYIFQKLDQEESGLEIPGAKAQILIEASRILVVEGIFLSVKSRKEFCTDP